jgi:hypothetical protein
MRPLETTDTQRVAAATGWLELGCPVEAAHELDRVHPINRRHPDVLETRWRVFADAREWKVAAAVADSIVEVAPARVSGWLHRAYALRRSPEGGLTAALEALRPAVARFPEVPGVAYNLACYECQLGNLPAARDWLSSAFETAGRTGQRQRFREMAEMDPDLAPLRTSEAEVP